MIKSTGNPAGKCYESKAGARTCLGQSLMLTYTRRIKRQSLNIVGIIKKKRRKKMPSLSQRGHFCSQRDCPPVSIQMDTAKAHIHITMRCELTAVFLYTIFFVVTLKAFRKLSLYQLYFEVQR
jgi:hypothetical protein